MDGSSEFCKCIIICAKNKLDGIKRITTDIRKDMKRSGGGEKNKANRSHVLAVERNTFAA